MIRKFKIIVYKLMGIWRKLTSPIINFIMVRTHKKLKGKFKSILHYNIKEFADTLNKYKYIGDPYNGFFDFTWKDPDYFFVKENVKDCDDWAYLFYLYSKHHNFEAFLMSLVDESFKHGHAFTIMKLANKSYVLCNYTISFHSSYEECLNQFSEKEMVSSGKYKNPIYRINKHYKPN